MPAMFFILGMTMLFMFIFIASKDLGYAKPLLSVAYVGLWLYCMFEAVGMYRNTRTKKKDSNQVQSDYKRQIQGRSYSERISGDRWP
tara:strand:+ start:2643 stop:2903 length:261 start_codon:yes stop_codon:yes gene_type:complete